MRVGGGREKGGREEMEWVESEASGKTHVDGEERGKGGEREGQKKKGERKVRTEEAWKSVHITPASLLPLPPT